MKNFRMTGGAAVAISALALILGAGTASADMLTGSGSITANRGADNGDGLTAHKLQRDTSTRYQPRDSAVTISGNVDFGGIADDGAVFIGLVDADFYDNNPDDLSTYQSGAYAYFAPSSETFAPTDGNAGSGELLDDRGSTNGNTAGDFSLTINPDGTLSVTFAGQTVTEDYGDVKGRPDVNGGTSTPYSAAEFANGAYLAVELASSHGDNGDETVTYNLNVTGGGVGGGGANNVPEPSELGLLALGVLLIGGGLASRRRKGQLIG